MKATKRGAVQEVVVIDFLDTPPSFIIYTVDLHCSLSLTLGGSGPPRSIFLAGV